MKTSSDEHVDDPVCVIVSRHGDAGLCVGASLPVPLIQMCGLPLARTLTGGDFAQEIVRTLAGSIGLVLAIP